MRFVAWLFLVLLVLPLFVPGSLLLFLFLFLFLLVLLLLPVGG